MEVRYSVNPKDVKRFTTDELRDEFLIQGLFQTEIQLVYSHVDRMIQGSVAPTSPRELKVKVGENMGVSYFLERRELGVINIGGSGKVSVDGTVYDLARTDGLYVGMGAKKVVFSSDDTTNPAKFYFNSAPAHKTYPTVKIERGSIAPRHLGSIETSNERNLYQYIIPGRVESCQMVMGMTALEPGNMWNSMPCHTHERRMEVYMYFDLPETDVVMHYMGQPQETRHVVMHNEEAIISPSWSIHSGVGTHNYTFIWGMVGENQEFDDMDNIKIPDLR